MLGTSLPPWPSFTEAEIAAASETLRSNRVNYWTGDVCKQFEDEFARYTGTRHAIAMANGTLALEAALRAVGVGPGDEVVVTPRTFLASASCIVMVGAIPVFADVDADSQNITAATVAAVLTPKTRAIICVHLAGWPCEMDAILELARAHRLHVIEDCAQAHGATYRGRKVGQLGDIGAWSFCQDKIMTTGGEGGMVTTDQEELWSKMWSLKDHGKSWDAVNAKNHPPGFRWLNENFGSNYRLTEFQAAIGRVQLHTLENWIAARGAHAQVLQRTLAPYPFLRVPMPPPHLRHAWYKFYAFVKPEALPSGWTRNRLMAVINAASVPCYSGSCPEIYLEKAFDGTGWRPAERLPVAKLLGETSLMFLVHPTITTADMAALCGRLSQALDQV